MHHHWRKVILSNRTYRTQLFKNHLGGSLETHNSFQYLNCITGDHLTTPFSITKRLCFVFNNNNKKKGWLKYSERVDRTYNSKIVHSQV